jgi:hypothetical protein
MKGQGDLFKSGYLNNKPPEPKLDIFNILEIKPHDTAGIRGAALQPIAQEIKKEKLSPLAVAEGFYKIADEFRKEGERQLTGGE